MKKIIPETLSQLLPLLPEIPAAPLSEMRFSALGRIYIALHNLVADNDLDDEYGDRAEYRRRIEALTVAGWQSYPLLTDFEARGRMLHMLFSLTYEPFAVAAEGRETACIHAAETLLEEFLEGESTAPRTTPAADPRGLADAMRCAADLVSPGMVRKAAYKRWFQRHIAEWAFALGEDGTWSQLPYHDALRRIGVMNRDSYMFPGSPYDARIRRAYEHYRFYVDVPQRPEELDRKQLRDLGLLYEVAVQGNAWKPEPVRTARIITFLRNAASQLPAEDDMWVYCLAFAVRDQCEQINERIQQEATKPRQIIRSSMRHEKCGGRTPECTKDKTKTP